MVDAAPNERLLVELAQAGDYAAYGELFRYYYPIVCSFIKSRIQSAHLAEDLASDTFLKAWKNIESFRWIGHDFGAWLFTIARHRIYDHFNHNYGRREAPHALVMELVDAQPDVDADPGIIVPDQVSAARAADVLRAATARVTDEQRAVIQLRFMEYASVADTAAALGGSVNRVKSLQYRAVRAVGKALARSGILSREDL